MVQELNNEQTLDDIIIGNIGYILKTGIFPTNKEELKDFNKSIKEMLYNHINESNSVEEIKDDLFYALF